MHRISYNVFQKLGLSFLYTYGRFEPKLRGITAWKLIFSSFLIKRLDFSDSIMQTCPYYVYSLKPHFYIVKTGVYSGIHFFLIFALKQRSWVLVRSPH